MTKIKNTKNIWNRKTLNFLWIILGLIFISTIASGIPLRNDPEKINILFYDYILKQTSWLLVINVLLEIFIRYLKKGFEYILVLAAALITLFILLHALNHGANVIL